MLIAKPKVESKSQQESIKQNEEIPARLLCTRSAVIMSLSI